MFSATLDPESGFIAIRNSDFPDRDVVWIDDKAYNFVPEIIETFIELINDATYSAKLVPDDRLISEVVSRLKIDKKLHDFYRPFIEVLNKKLKKKESQRKPIWLDKIKENQAKENYRDNKAIIVDLDGTLAFPSDRSFYEEEKCESDIPNYPVTSLIYQYWKNGYKILFVSGRQDKARTQTEAWLCRHVLGSGHAEFFKKLSSIYGCYLFMRQTGDMRDDSIVKEEIYKNFIEKDFYVDAVFDDRPRVVRTWETIGLFVFNCNQGNVEF